MSEQGGGVTDGEKLPPRLLPTLVLCDQCAPLVQPPLTRLPRESFSEYFFPTLAAAPLNLRGGIYNTALVDIPPLTQWRNAAAAAGEKVERAEKERKIDRWV